MKIKIFVLTIVLTVLFLSTPAHADENILNIETTPIEQTAFTLTHTDNGANIRLQFPNVIEYLHGDISVRLYLDESSIATRPQRSPTYTYTTTRTREISGLERNDPVLIERTWEGLTLQDVSFTRVGERNYTAHAVYAGTATGTRDVWFISTARYFGERGVVFA